MADNSTLQYAQDKVAAAFPGIFLIAMPAAATFGGISPKTARNLLWSGKLPFATLEQRGKRYVPADELARWLAAQLAAAGFRPPAPAVAGTSTEAGKRRPGRPRKMAVGGV